MEDRIYTEVSIDGVNIAEQFGFYLVDRSLSDPVVKTTYIDVPAANGSYDASEALGLFYEDRDMPFTFLRPDLSAWAADKSALSNYLHGRKRKIVFADDPNWYYIGRISLDQYDSTSHTQTGRARVFPYKLAVTPTVVTQNGSGTVELENDEMPVVPEITATAAATFVWGTNSVTVSAGTYRIAGLELPKGITEVAVTTDGEVTFTYRKGRL